VPRRRLAVGFEVKLQKGGLAVGRALMTYAPRSASYAWSATKLRSSATMRSSGHFLAYLATLGLAERQ
jgi:hypothetical protein